MFKRGGSGRAGLPYRVGVYLGRAAAGRRKAVVVSRARIAPVVAARAGRVRSGIARMRWQRIRKSGRRRCPRVSRLFKKKVRCAMMDDKELFYQAIAGVTTAGGTGSWNTLITTNMNTTANGVDQSQSYTIVDPMSALPQGDTNITRSGDDIQLMRYDTYLDVDFYSASGSNTGQGHPGTPWIMIEYMLCEIVGSDQSIPSSSDFTNARVLDQTWAGRNKRPEFFDTNVGVAATAVKRKLWKVLKKKTVLIRNPMYKMKSTQIAALAGGGATPQPFFGTYGLYSNTTAATLLPAHVVQKYGYWSFGKEGRNVHYKAAAGAVSDITKGRQFFAFRVWTHSDAANNTTVASVTLKSRYRYKD